MHGVDVLIPWRSGCPHRQAALTWVLDRLVSSFPGWNIVVGVSARGEWCKAAAVADGLTRCTGDLLIIHDADVWCAGLQQAVDQVDAGAPWAIPHYLVHRLDQPATQTLLSTSHVPAGRDQEPYVGHDGGGIVVVPRETYVRIPFDPRFHGWGREDDSLALALSTLAGRPWRGDDDLIHLWHPPQHRTTREDGSPESHRLYRRYCAAGRKREAMRLLIDEHLEST